MNEVNERIKGHLQRGANVIGMISLKPIQINTPEYELFIKICNESFPACERDEPQNFFVTPSHFNNETYGIFLDEQMVGYLMAWHGGQLAYILEFAVAASMRGQGIGVKALQLFKERFAELCIILCCENPDPHADNSVQRQQRYDMYRRNGFIDTGVVIRIYGIDFVCMSSEVEVPKAELELMLKELASIFTAWNI